MDSIRDYVRTALNGVRQRFIKLEKDFDKKLTGLATEKWVKDQNYMSEVPEGYAKTTDISEFPKYRELEQGKTVYHALVRVESAAYGGVYVEYLERDVNDTVIAEVASQYELTIVHTKTNGTVNTYNGSPNGQIDCIRFIVNDNRLFEINGVVNSENIDFLDNGTLEITIKTPDNKTLAKSPHNAFVGVDSIKDDVDWESDTLDDEIKVSVPSIKAVQEGLQIFGQTYTTYQNNESTEPIEVVLQNRIFYDFGNTPKITVNRSNVSGDDAYCCFVFSCGDTATELLDAVKTDGTSNNWPLWFVQGSIKPNRAYRCIIHQGIPFLEEYTYDNTNSMTTMLKEMSNKVKDVDCNFWVPTNMPAVIEAYNKYAHLYGRIGTDSDEFQNAYAEVKAANDAVVQRKGEHPVLPFEVSRYIAVGGEEYRTMTSSAKSTASEGMQLFKVTIPPVSDWQPGVNMDERLPIFQTYLCVYNGSKTSLTSSNDTYGIYTEGCFTNGATFYFKPTSLTQKASFNTEVVFRQYSDTGANIVTTTKKNGSTKVVTYNGLPE